MTDRGLDAEGFIRREGSPSRVQPQFAELVADYVAGCRDPFGDRLDGVYLYGSIPRGNARVAVSDLDGQVLYTSDPTDDDLRALRDLERCLAAAHPVVSRVEILAHRHNDLTTPEQRHDGGFHLRVLCTPFWGTDRGVEVPRHRPDIDLARGVQGDWRAALERFRSRAAEPGADARALARSIGRRLARMAFTWVMPRWGGWTSDPAVMAGAVAQVEPGWSRPMAEAVELGWEGRADLTSARRLLDDWGGPLTEAGEALGA